MNQLHAIYDVSLIVLSQDSEDTLDLRIGNVDQDFDTQRNILTLHNGCQHCYEESGHDIEKPFTRVFVGKKI